MKKLQNLGRSLSKRKLWVVIMVMMQNAVVAALAAAQPSVEVLIRPVHVVLNSTIHAIALYFVKDVDSIVCCCGLQLCRLQLPKQKKLNQ